MTFQGVVLEVTGLSLEVVQLIGVYHGPEAVDLDKVSVKWLLSLLSELESQDRVLYYHKLFLTGRLEVVEQLSIPELELDLDLISQTLTDGHYPMALHLVQNSTPIGMSELQIVELLAVAIRSHQPEICNSILQWFWPHDLSCSCSVGLLHYLLRVCAVEGDPCVPIMQSILDAVTPHCCYLDTELRSQLVSLARNSPKMVLTILNYDHVYHRRKFLWFILRLLADSTGYSLVAGFSVALIWLTLAWLGDPGYLVRIIVSCFLSCAISYIATGTQHEIWDIIILIDLNILLWSVIAKYIT